jgi:hypothetical protein
MHGPVDVLVPTRVGRVLGPQNLSDPGHFTHSVDDLGKPGYGALVRAASTTVVEGMGVPQAVS